MDKMFKLAIPAAVFSVSVIAFTGCQQKEVLADRPYIAAPVSDVSVPPAPPVTMMPNNSGVIAPAENTAEEVIVEETAFTTTEPVVEETLPAVQEPAPKTSKYPKFVGVKTSPAVSSYKPSTAASSKAVAGKDVYVVQKNDTLSQIAQRHGVKTADLAAVNGISTNSIIRVGQKLKMPVGSKKVQNVKSSSSKAASSAKTTKTTKAEYPADGVYTVKSGDSLWLIARRFDTTVAKICEANNISADTRLQIGQKIKLPGAAATAAKPAENKSATSTVTATPATPATTTTTTTATPAPASTTDNTATTTTTTATETVSVTTPAGTETETVTVETTAPATPDIPTTQPAEITTQTAVVPQDIMLESYCKLYRWNLDDVLRLNPNLNKDSVLKAGETIVLPSSTN